MPGQYIVKQGNVLEPQLLYDDDKIKENIVIPHVVNNLGIMGAGVALALRDKWPEVEKEYLSVKHSYGLKLGDISWVNVGERTVIVNMVAQDGIRRKDNPKPLKYFALIECMRQVQSIISCLKKGPDIKKNVPEIKNVIHAPKFGSDLAGGKWELIEELIKEIWIDNNIDVVIYEFKK